jgi:hypothetical protein
MSRIRRAMSRPVVATLAVLVVVGLGFGLYWFQPWALFVDRTVEEKAPTAASPTPDEPGEATSEETAPERPAPSEEPSGPVTLATGEFISHEHSTTGAVHILRLEDDSLVLRLTDLDTSNGPDLHVWITDAPVIEGRDGWGVFDDGVYLSAGKLKGMHEYFEGSSGSIQVWSPCSSQSR